MIPETHLSKVSSRTHHQEKAKKVTYNLPRELVEELALRSSKLGRSKSMIVRAALKEYFGQQDRQELAKIYSEAARDPLFQADNEAILCDFAGLDPDWDEEVRREA